MQRFTVCLLVLFVPVGAARAEVIIDTDTTLDYDVSDSVRVIAGASPPTTVQFLEPGDADNMTVYDDSIVNMTAGYIGGYLEGYDSATLNVSDGFFGLGLKAHDQSTLNVSGGGTELLYVYDESVTDFSGGYYELVKVRDSAHMDIRGNAKMDMLSASGTSTMDIFGGDLSWPEASGSSVITIHGTDFNYPYGEIPDVSGVLTGTLANGDLIDGLPFHIYDDASIVLVPEPSTLVLLSLAFVALSGCLRRRR